MLEHEFILNYTAKSAEKTQSNNIDLSKLDWRYILQKAIQHNIAPLLYDNIRQLSIPKDITKELEKIYTYTAFHNMIYLDELKNILEKIRASGIKIIALKGASIAQNIYINIALRPFSDMDLFVKKQDLEKTITILRSSGYTTSSENFYKKYHFHIPFVKNNKIPIHIELHWEFVDKFIIHKMDINQILDKLDTNELSSEINILYLLLHIEKHAFFNKALYDKGNPRNWIFTNPLGNQLIWYVDIYKLLSKNKIDWLQLENIAEKSCVQNIMYYNMYILNKLYPIAELENMPRPQLGPVKKFIYNKASKRKNIFQMQHDIQLRPVRAIDLINYIFPPPLLMKNLYCNKHNIPVTLSYALHFIIAAKEIFNEFIGICKQKFLNNAQQFPQGN